MGPYIKNPNSAWRPAQDHDVKPLFGLDAKAKWPEQGLPMRNIQGVRAWVEPLQPGRFRLRAMCQCPTCGRTMPIGRLAQHAKIH